MGGADLEGYGKAGVEELGAEFEGEFGGCAGVMWGVGGQVFRLKEDGLFDNRRSNPMFYDFMTPALMGS